MPDDKVIEAILGAKASHSSKLCGNWFRHLIRGLILIFDSATAAFLFRRTCYQRETIQKPTILMLLLMIACWWCRFFSSFCVKCLNSRLLPAIAPLPERWPSGRRRSPAKGVYPEGYRGFESHPLRHYKIQSKIDVSNGAIFFKIAIPAASILSFSYEIGRNLWPIFIVLMLLFWHGKKLFL